MPGGPFISPGDLVIDSNNLENVQMSDSTVNDAKYKAEFKAEPAYAKSMTESEYVSMRRVDEGIDVLSFAAAPEPPVTPIELNPLASGL